MTFPGPAALISWPSVPRISMPFCPCASLKRFSNLPLAGHCQSVLSSAMTRFEVSLGATLLVACG